MPARVVLDTNVCLDAFVFGDPRAAPLLAAIESGEVEAVTHAECREEWLAVLSYPTLKLDDAKREVAASRFDALLQVLPDMSAVNRPPRCRDKDDQKFLDIAAASGASVLFSRDAEVLRLARRTRREGLFEIMRPEDWPAYRDSD
ncbi:putative toxin-antitoxin system toxin component, PIN family [Luteibacter anthropi]|uniref:putative toxin-antitoxin system toxin component, PIN family n=1 Tax=Luteibacter anthropi TaxID=564369 RepID=UPI00203308D2|nr:putative toxin-antitoxin system toxin component, PIN family [Luteibacter anthropi]URX63886.1 putative toxin-antitoxin system toxin component, PIN family [Luteibacter anthropi]